MRTGGPTQKGMVAAVALFGAAVAGGCATENHYNDLYAIVPAQYLVVGKETYEIFDRPDLGQLAIAPRGWQGIAMGIAINNVPGNLANLYGSQSPGSHFYDPVQQFFTSTGRTCQVTRGYQLIAPQWEFRYRCEGLAGSGGWSPRRAPK